MFINTKEYLDLITEIKRDIVDAQQRIMVNANKELIILYWKIGNNINTHKKWGDKFVKNMARDIKADFPNMHGFSERNLNYMAKFASIYNDVTILQKVSVIYIFSSYLSSV